MQDVPQPLEPSGGCRREHELTTREFELIGHLARNLGKVVPRENLFERVWGYDMSFNSNSLEVYIYRIRKKIEADPNNPRHMKTVRGFGYSLTG